MSRVVKVTLAAAVDDYRRAMRQAADATHEVGDAGDRVTRYREAFRAVGASGVAMGGLLAAGFGVAVKKSAEFDQAMSAVQAATRESSANMDALREAAIEAGASTVFSATEAANAIEELAKAGVSTQDILGGGLKGALDLAAAGNLGVAEAAGIAATSLRQFNLEGGDMSHVADLLAAGAGKAMGDVTDLSQALNQAGLVADQTGLSIEETTAGLAAFAEQGLIGSDAGTSFKAMLQRLTPQSAEADRLMKQLGISAYDASGNFIGLASFAGNLQGALKDLTPEQRNAAMATIFGSDAVRAAGVLYAQGEEGIRNWTQAVDDQGYAAETAAARLDNLNGDLEALQGAFDTALIQTGSAANDTLRTMVQALTGLIGMYNELPDEVQSTVMAVGGATAAVALSGGTALLAVPKWLEFKDTVNNAGLSMKGITLTAAGTGLALGGLLAIVGTLAAEHQQARQKAQAYADTLEDGTQQITDATRDLIAENLTAKESFAFLETTSAADAAKDLGISLETVRKAVEGDAEAITELDAVTQSAIDAYNFWDNETIALHSSAQLLRQEVEAETGSLTAAAQAARDKAEATGESADAAESAKDAYVAESDAVSDLNDELTGLIDKINEANGVGQDAVTANARWQSALAGLTDQVEQNGSSLDQATEAGSANAAALADVAAKAQDAASAQFEQDKATMSSKAAADKYYKTLQNQRQAFIDSAVAAGYNKDEVVKLADQVFKLPTEREINVIANTDTAAEKLRLLKDRLASIPEYKRITLETFSYGSHFTDVRPNAEGGIYSGGVKEFAAGGVEPGIYPYTPGGIHKFAEQHDEAYISMDPKRCGRSYGVWVEAGNRFGFTQPQQAQAAGSGPVVNNNFSGPVYGQDPREIAHEYNKLTRRAMNQAGLKRTVGD